MSNNIQQMERELMRLEAQLPLAKGKEEYARLTSAIASLELKIEQAKAAAHIAQISRGR